MTQILRASRLLAEQSWLDDRQLHIEEGIMTAVKPILAGIAWRDAELLGPAYIDTHVHGTRM